MSLRRTCPLCRKPWDQRKDPVEADANALMSLRVGDLVKGLSASSQSMEADLFHGEPSPVSLRALAQRTMELEEAEFLVMTALERIGTAKADLAATPVAMGAKAYVQERGFRADMDSLDTCHRLDIDGYSITTDGDVLLITEDGDGV